MTDGAAGTHRGEADYAGADDAGLVALALEGDLAAFEALYARHSRPLFRTVIAVTRNKGAAEELLQEAFLRAYRHLGRVRLDPGASLRPWLHRIAINLAYDWAARQKRAPRSLDTVVDRLVTASHLSPERQAEQSERSRIVTEAIDSLPFKHRIVVVLFYLHDMELSDIAQLLNLPEGTVKSRLYYGRGKLRESLIADKRLTTRGGIRYAPVQPPLA